MSRYIDADALGKNIIEKYSGRSNGKAIATMALDIINNAPTADVVEVVRCKDCIHNHEHETSFGSKFHICNLNKLAFTQYADFYCAYGERREDDKGRNTTSV